MMAQTYTQSLSRSLYFFIGFVLVSVVSLYQLSTYLVTKSFSSDQIAFEKQDSLTKTNRPAMPTTFSLPAREIYLDIEAQSFNNGIWQISDSKANYLLQSARPSETGNIIIYGHNTWDTFAALQATHLGDIIAIVSQDKTVHRYLVSNKVVVETDRTEYLAQTKSEVLTIYTCYGWLDQQRLIIQATPIVTG